MDDASTPNKKRRVRTKWQCVVQNCSRWSQPGHNSMCKNHYKESSLRQSNNDELSQSNNDAQQGAIVLAAFSDHFNNREINSNVCNEEATRNNVPAVSHQQNINTIVECVADNNTTVSRVELQPAAENVVVINDSVLTRQLQCATEGEVNGQSANSSSSINSIGGICAENNTTEIHDVIDESVGTRQCVDLQCATKGEVNGQPPKPFLIPIIIPGNSRK